VILEVLTQIAFGGGRVDALEGLGNLIATRVAASTGSTWVAGASWR